jgi:hypothetical protein
MRLEDYITELENDLKFDELSLKDYQQRLPGIKHKWAGRCIRHKLELITLKKNKDKLKRAIVDKINEMSPVKLTAPVAERTAENSNELTEADARIKEIELVIELLEKSRERIGGYKQFKKIRKY